MDARASFAPAGDSIGFYWFYSGDAGCYQGALDIGAENYPGKYITAPVVTQTETMHFIVRVTDKGEPPLTRYERIIVTVEPRTSSPEPAGTRLLRRTNSLATPSLRTARPDARLKSAPRAQS
jgi:hypothetical protein